MSNAEYEAKIAPRRAWLEHRRTCPCGTVPGPLCARAIELGRAMQAVMLPDESLPEWLTALLNGAES